MSMSTLAASLYSLKAIALRVMFSASAFALASIEKAWASPFSETQRRTLLFKVIFRKLT